jgi:hypothetical protein
VEMLVILPLGAPKLIHLRHRHLWDQIGISREIRVGIRGPYQALFSEA